MIIMKTSIPVLMATMAIMMVGCSDDSTLPVSPTDQAAQGMAPLAKSITREFTTTEGPDLANPAGYIVDPGFSPPHNKNKMIVRGMVVRNRVNATSLDGGTDLLSGKGVLEMNFTYDYSAAKGECWGKLTLDPDAFEGGDCVWEITWNGTITVPSPGVFVCPTKWVGHGKGGAIDRMQFSSDDQVMTIWDMPNAGWTGSGTGFVKSH
jgi:hypothetical protein